MPYFGKLLEPRGLRFGHNGQVFITLAKIITHAESERDKHNIYFRKNVIFIIFEKQGSLT
jgi:hypothetical protein